MEIEKILDYKLEKKVGIGGDVTLYLASKIDNPSEKFIVSLYDEKLAQDKVLVERFIENFHIIKNLQHPHIVKTLDYEIQTNYLAQITEFVEGQNLQFLVLIRGLSKIAIIELFSKILQATHYAHKQSVLHYNFKPSNIIVKKDLDNLKVIEFGATNVVFYNQEAIKKYTFETPMFCSPEFVSGQKCDVRSDIYSLGVLLYFMFSHKTPYLKTAPNDVIVQHIINDPLPEIKGYGRINDVIAKATNKDIDERYKDCEEFLYDVKNL